MGKGRWRKLSIRQQMEIARRYASGEKTSAIAADYGVSDAYPTMVAARRGVPRRFPRKLYPQYAKRPRIHGE